MFTKNKTLSRVTAFVMLLCMLLSTFPSAAFADGGEIVYALNEEEVLTDTAIQPAAGHEMPAVPEAAPEVPPQELPPQE